MSVFASCSENIICSFWWINPQYNDSDLFLNWRYAPLNSPNCHNYISSSGYKHVRQRRSPSSCSGIFFIRVSLLPESNREVIIPQFQALCVLYKTKSLLSSDVVFHSPGNELSICSFVYSFYPISVYLPDRDSRGNHIVWNSEIRDIVVTLRFLMDGVRKHTQTQRDWTHHLSSVRKTRV